MSYKLITVWGIPIRIHISLVALLAIVAIWAWHIGGMEDAFWNVSLLVVVFISIVLHELAHSLVAIRKGCRVREITLMFIGGAAQMDELPRNPADEIQVAAVGPIFSVLLGCLAWFGGYWVPLPANLPSLIDNHPLNLVQLAGQINFGLALFNLLPAFPMDGGRIFRALMSRKIGFLPATFVASRLGRVAAIIMGVVGFYHSWWGLMIIAVFLFRAAGREFDYVLREEMKDGFQTLTWAMGGGQPPAPSVKDLGGQVKISPPPYKSDSP